MRGAVLASLLLAIAGLLHAAHAAEPGDALPGVQDLTPNTFDAVVGKNQAVLVEFYAPWCGHCKSLTPEMKKLGAKVQEDPVLKNLIAVAKVDADAHSSLGERFGVSGFPAIKYFPPGSQKPIDYKGGRKASKFLSYLTKKANSEVAFMRVAALDALVAGASEAGDAAQLAKQLEKEVAGLEGREQENGQLYLSFAQKAVAKGKEYYATEKARLERVVAAGGVQPAKASEMVKKASILGAFLPAPAPPAEEEAKPEGSKEEL